MAFKAIRKLTFWNPSQQNRGFLERQACDGHAWGITSTYDDGGAVYIQLPLL